MRTSYEMYAHRFFKIHGSRKFILQCPAVRVNYGGIQQWPFSTLHVVVCRSLHTEEEVLPPTQLIKFTPCKVVFLPKMETEFQY